MSKSSFNSPVTACCSSRAHEDIKQLIVLQVYWLKLRLIYFQTSPLRSQQLTAWSPASPSQALPIWWPEPSQGRLRQIASLLCKFVQAINSISLGVPIWQQEWLESWAARRLSLGTEMRAELQWSLKLCAIVTSLCSCPLFSIHPAPHAHVCPLYSILQGCGNKVWLVETKPKGNCLRWETRNSSDLYYRAHLPSPECKNLWFGRWNMQSLRGNEIED